MFQCFYCLLPRYVYQIVMPVSLHFPAILLSGIFYWLAIKTLNKSKSINRSGLITKVFAIQFVFWTITSVPYLVFRATDDLGFWRDQDNVEQGSFYFLMSKLSLKVNVFDYSDYNDIPLDVINRLWLSEKVFRTFKISYGFINSLLLIILLKPFSRPIKQLLKKIYLIKK